MKFLFAGDFYPNTEKAKRIIDDRQYMSVMKDTVPYIKESDFSIVNFESPIANPDKQQPFIKKGPRNLCSSKNAMECVKETGFSMIALANNHFHDYGDVGVRQTIEACNEFEIPFCGAGMTLLEAQTPKMVAIDGKIISVINYCENEFSVATSSSAGANPFNLVDIVHQINSIRSKSDYVLVFVHGGVEHYQLPTPMMVKNYRFLIEMGADIVVNSHQHCFNGYEIYQGKPIVYGLGNFFFDNGSTTVTQWNEGYMAMIEEKDNQYTVTAIPYLQGMDNMTISVLEDSQAFNQRLATINEIIQNPKKIACEFDSYVNKNYRTLLSYFEPYTSRVALKLYRMGIFPSLLSKKKRVLLLNRIRCESHQLVYSKVLSQSLNFPF